MCVSSCPKGYYASDADSQCYECPPADNCAACELILGVAKCTSCVYGYYFQTSTKTCVQSC